MKFAGFSKVMAQRIMGRDKGENSNASLHCFHFKCLGGMDKEIKLKMGMYMGCLYLAPTHNITLQ